MGRIVKPGILRAATRSGVSRKKLAYYADEIYDAEIYNDGAYWSGRHLGTEVHGEAWHLAALASGRDPEVSSQEVLYVGQAFGEDGNRNASLRAKSHSQLIRAYEQNYASDWDVFFTPIVVDETSLSNDDHIVEDDGNWAWTDNMEGLFSPDGRHSSKLAIDVLEHMLIAYFRPVMNTKLKQWSTTKPNARLRELGIRLLSVQFQSLHELSAFFSADRRAARSHSIAAEVPGSVHGGEFTIGEYSSLPTDPLSFANIMGSSMATIAAAAERSAGILPVFGETHPQLNPDFSAWG